MLSIFIPDAIEAISIRTESKKKSNQLKSYIMTTMYLSSFSDCSIIIFDDKMSKQNQQKKMNGKESKGKPYLIWFIGGFKANNLLLFNIFFFVLR